MKRPLRRHFDGKSKRERELAIVEGIKQGLDDMRAGRTVPHEEAMQLIAATIARPRRRRLPKRP
jgi:predicted transcriptional regulator